MLLGFVKAMELKQERAIDSRRSNAGQVVVVRSSPGEAFRQEFQGLVPLSATNKEEARVIRKGPKRGLPGLGEPDP